MKVDKSVRITTATREKLKSLKSYTDETYDHVINRLCQKEEDYLATVTSLCREYEIIVGESNRNFKVNFTSDGGDLLFYDRSSNSWSKDIYVWDLNCETVDLMTENTLIMEYFQRFRKSDGFFVLLKNMGNFISYDGFDIRALI